MARDVTINAEAGAIHWGYYSAGSLRSCVLTRTEGVWTLAGTVVESDAYRLSQRPLVFVVTHQHGSWTWPIVSLQIEGGSCSASLGPPEVPDGYHRQAQDRQAVTQ